MNILHFEDTGGVSVTLRDAQRELGHTARVVLTWRSPLKYNVDVRNYYGPGRLRTLRQMWKSIRLAEDADVVHMHGGATWNRFDYLGCKYINKTPMIMHYHGGEVRSGRGLHYRHLADAKIVATPDLLNYEWTKGAIFIPNPQSCEGMTFNGIREKGPLVIGHYPTIPAFKGTDIVLQAMDMLSASRNDFIFDTILYPITHDEVLRRLQNCDIIIDQVGDPRMTGVPGLFGMISLEAMAMGKVAVSNLSPEYRDKYPEGNPIVRGYPDSFKLFNVLTHLLDYRNSLSSLGAAGRKYVEIAHNPITIAKRILNIYEKII